jgi:hypothetical protein
MAQTRYSGGAAVVFLLANLALADSYSIGPNGINSVGLVDFDGTPLTGAGVVIGQVEPGRPGDADVGDDLAHRNTTTNPAGVFIQNNPDDPPPNTNVSDHAQEVAGVMISTDATDGNSPPDDPNVINGIAPTGLATGAALFSSAYVTAGINPGYRDAMLTIQFIATRPNMRAVNHSWGKEAPAFPGLLDGNSQLTLGLDWSARQHDVLHLVAGNQGDVADTPIPKDNFNGMTIARSVRAADGVFRQVSPRNNYDADAEGERTSIAIIAPGDDLELNLFNNAHRITAGGTSYATPHVTGTVALLQQYANERIMDGGWNATRARRHEVMKAVLMNSADKIIDDGTFTIPGDAGPAPPGTFLGMERTVIGQQGMNWLQSDAYADEFIPLDEQMGAGHLNAKRALQQFSPGEYDSDGADVPLIGWDYGHTAGEDDNNKYAFSQPLVGGSFLSITLAWDRHVEFQTDTAPFNEFNSGDTFKPSMSPAFQPENDDQINDLDIHLLPKGALNLGAEIATSFSAVGTLEHLFFRIPVTGEYEFWINQFDADIAGGQDYAVAWWAAAVPNPNPAQGDYSGNGTVGPEDYNIWKANFGTSFAAADGNGNGVVDAADYTVWRDHLGQFAGGGSAGAVSSLVSVPEPRGTALLAMAGARIACPIGRRRSTSKCVDKSRAA